LNGFNRKPSEVPPSPSGIREYNIQTDPVISEPSISVVGIGLNVFNREPTTCLQALLEDLRPGAAPLVKEELLAFIINRFDELHTTFMYAGEREFVGLVWLYTQVRKS
jgi:biotin-(acetyl-CoA carboxylase) ligase